MWCNSFKPTCPHTLMKYQTNQLGLFLLIVRSRQLEDWSVGRARKVCVDDSVHGCKTWNYMFVNHLSNFLWHYNLGWKCAYKAVWYANRTPEQIQARRECVRARWQNLTPEEKEEINARRREQGQRLTLDVRNARQWARRQSMTLEERQEINARRRERKHAWHRTWGAASTHKSMSCKLRGWTRYSKQGIVCITMSVKFIDEKSLIIKHLQR
jgi:hypothetical protein